MRRPGLRLLLAALAVAGAVLVLGRGQSPPVTEALVPGSESAEVARRMRTEFGSPLAEAAVLLLEPLPVSAASDSGRALVRAVVRSLAAVPGITAVISPASSLDTLLHTRDGAAAIALVGVRGPDVLPAARAAVAESVAALAARGVDLRAGWTGEALLRDALRDTMLAAMRSAEWIALPLTLAIAWWGFGGVVGGTVAILVAIAAVLIGLGLMHLAVPPLPGGASAQAVLVLVGVALTLDYLLWRGMGGLDHRAIRRAAWCAAIAFATLLLAPTAELRGAAVGGLVAIVVATCAAALRPTGGPAPGAPRAVARLVRLATDRPVAVSAGALLLAAPLGVVGITTPTASRADRWLPPAAEATTVLRRLDAIGRGATAAPVTVLLPMPPGVTVYDETGWTLVASEGRRLAGVSGAAEVRSLVGIGTGERRIAREVLPPALRAAWVAPDERTAVLQLLPAAGAASPEALVHAVRAIVAPGTQVGGLAAVGVDHATAMRAALGPLLALMAIGTALALLATFRAPVLALKAVAVDLLVACAALGVAALCFPEVRQVGFPVTVPLLALGAAFALSIDYELLLLFAVRDARHAGLGGADAVREATLRATPMMVRGGAMLVALFAAVATRDFAPLAMTGTVLLATVLLDITLVRMALAPALLVLWGRWNWWPGSGGGAITTRDVT